ncbi:MAG: hypothetical protein EU542_03885 [Promethearchaeota archaeon]|nr:MAG: hypothetical protein EU542_03885 [Candidatus Lokiarchaeota archaeon]
MRKNNKKKIIFSSIIIALLCLNTFALLINSSKENESIKTSLFPTTSQISPENLRVAIYNEPNVTEPAYSSASTLTNNYSALIPLLTSAGFGVTELTTQDIYDHKLMIADYDVFIMVDNLPKVNISNYVKEFWLGGGALISFDSAAPYLLWSGILVPESEGDEGHTTYYAYTMATNNHSIATRTPITKNNQVGDTIQTIGASINFFYWTTLQGTTYGSDFIRLAYQEGDSDHATMIALDSSYRGGRIVHLPGRGAELSADMENIFIEAVIWACPTPKGRILFDLSHNPEYGIDLWDDLSDNPGFYEIWRDNLVNRSYVIDKLYPSPSGNLTTSNLAPYDVLILCFTAYNYSSSEISAVTNWVANGGGLFIIADQHDYLPAKDIALNELMSNFDISINITNDGTNTVTEVFEHPINEGVSQITALAPGLVNVDGNAFPILGNDLVNIIVGGEEYGNGRIILNADLATLRDSSISGNDNLQFGINLINWLTASTAEILLFVNEPWSDNYHSTPVANALNILDLRFYLTYSAEFLNLSLNLYDWDLVIVDEPWTLIDPSVFDTLLTYLKAGGKLIMSTYRVDNTPVHPLWSYIGFEFSADLPDSSPVYIWNDAHSIFNTPISYGANNYTPVLDYGDEGDLLTVFPNATALAGFNETEKTGNATIVLRNDGKVLFNSYLIDQFSGDGDDSTYEDRIELWIAEIYFIYNYEALTPQGGIPGFELGIFLIVTFSTIGLISVIIVFKKKK